MPARLLTVSKRSYNCSREHVVLSSLNFLSDSILRTADSETRNDLFEQLSHDWNDYFQSIRIPVEIFVNV